VLLEAKVSRMKPEICIITEAIELGIISYLIPEPRKIVAIPIIFETLKQNFSIHKAV
jgi:hypothetical protein